MAFNAIGAPLLIFFSQQLLKEVEYVIRSFFWKGVEVKTVVPGSVGNQCAVLKLKVALALSR